ncbi:MAG: Uncharacterised protein [Candidatus Poseidoniaceae archaeon]|nr:MAG: Uncharacterised protein [Candidatus Poseidoniaceae archaeon]
MLNPAAYGLLSLQDEVRDAFGWSEEADALSASEMSQQFLEDAPYGCLEWDSTTRQSALLTLKQSICSAERLVVVGAGSESISVSDYPGALFVAADGAVGAVDDLTKVLCVVSDGDGAEHLERAAQAGVHIALHAHGDNHDVWLRLVEAWAHLEDPPPLTLTHQANVELEGLHNPGGFTDGDRALCFIHALGRSLNEIECIGFRTDVVGQWSGTTNPERKMRKLAWMQESMRRLGVEHHLIR